MADFTETETHFVDRYGYQYPKHCPACGAYVGKPMLTQPDVGRPQYCPQCHHWCESEEEQVERLRLARIVAIPL